MRSAKWSENIFSPVCTHDDKTTGFAEIAAIQTDIPVEMISFVRFRLHRPSEYGRRRLVPGRLGSQAGEAIPGERFLSELSSQFRLYVGRGRMFGVVPDCVWGEGEISG